MDKKRVPIFTSTSFAAKSVPQVASSKQTDLLFSYFAHHCSALPTTSKCNSPLPDTRDVSLN